MNNTRIEKGILISEYHGSFRFLSGDFYFFVGKTQYQITEFRDFSHLKFNFSDNNTSAEFVKLPKFYEMKILTSFTWKD